MPSIFNFKIFRARCFNSTEQNSFSLKLSKIEFCACQHSQFPSVQTSSPPHSQPLDRFSEPVLSVYFLLTPFSERNRKLQQKQTINESLKFRQYLMIVLLHQFILFVLICKYYQFLSNMNITPNYKSILLMGVAVLKCSRTCFRKLT